MPHSIRKVWPVELVYVVPLLSGQTMAVDVGEALAEVLEPVWVEVAEADMDEFDPDSPLTSLAPQMFELDPAAPRVDLR